MTIMQMYLNELTAEAVVTRKLLERVPEGKDEWAPHKKSMPLMRLAVHVAELPSWAETILFSDELDFAKHPYKSKTVKNNAELIAIFDDAIEACKKTLTKANDEMLEGNWKLRDGDQIYVDAPRADFLRNTFSHLVHHRAQLGVYLRLLDIPIPGSYGPSADDQMK
jgi:uncharacterized damage-inducible protein DinB